MRGLDVLLAALDDAGAVSRDDDGPMSERERAVVVLGKVSDPRVTEALAGLIEDPNNNVRRAVLLQLAKRRDPRAIPPLVAQLGLQDGRGQSASSLLIGMGEMVIEPLLTALRDPDARVVAAAAAALEKVTGQKLGTDPAAWQTWWAGHRGDAPDR
jgi:HEAT repeat protein